MFKTVTNIEIPHNEIICHEDKQDIGMIEMIFCFLLSFIWWQKVVNINPFYMNG